VSEKTAVQRIKELDQERATLFEQAKEEALRRANQAVEDLNSLGLKYRLVIGTVAEGNKGAGKRKIAASLGLKKPQETGLADADKKRPPGHRKESR
jgi:hypothetical protein